MNFIHPLLALSQCVAAGAIALTGDSPRWFRLAEKVEHYVKIAAGLTLFVQAGVLFKESSFVCSLPTVVLLQMSALTGGIFLVVNAIAANLLLEKFLPDEPLNDPNIRLEWAKPRSSLGCLLVSQAVMNLFLLSFSEKATVFPLIGLLSTAFAFRSYASQHFIKFSRVLPNGELSYFARDFRGGEGECAVCKDPLEEPSLLLCQDRRHALHRTCAIQWISTCLSNNPSLLTCAVRCSRPPYNRLEATLLEHGRRIPAHVVIANNPLS